MLMKMIALYRPDCAYLLLAERSVLILSSNCGHSRTIEIAELGNGSRRYVNSVKVFGNVADG